MRVIDNRSMAGVILACLVCLGVSCYRPSDVYAAFSLNGSCLTVTTPALRLAISDGTVTELENLHTRERYTGTDASAASLSQAGVLIRDSATRKSTRRSPEGAPVVFRQVTPDEGELIYRKLSNGPPEDELHIGIRILEKGELAFRVEFHASNPSQAADEVYLPFVNLTCPAVIAGSGERFARTDPPGATRCMRIANNIYSPPVGVIEGVNGVVGMWPEPASYGYDDLTIIHSATDDQVIPQVSLAGARKDPEAAKEPGVTQSSWWRLAALPTWLAVAERYRVYLEKKSGVKLLWQHNPAWVRNIHAVTTERPIKSEPEEIDRFYAQLAAQFDPKKLLLFYWNGDCLIAFGDHRYFTNWQHPTTTEVTALTKHGFRWAGYYPYNLVEVPEYYAKLLEEAKQRGWVLPEGYVFQPDYAGPKGVGEFFDYFRPVSAPYYDGKTCWLSHPGAKLTRDYLVHNFGDYCRTHNMSGAYLDILGADHAVFFPDEKKIMDGLDYRRGEESVCREMKYANPDLALISEVQGEWTTVHTFLTWEGAHTHLTHPQPVRLNHPLRAACWGSYTWTGAYAPYDSPEDTVLMAGLPAVKLDDAWSIARAKLYMDEELYHDLPKKWDSQALAYFRGKNNKWFQYRRMPFGDAYVQVSRGMKVKLGRLIGQTEYADPASIQHWVGYRDGKPFALNPQAAYKFVQGIPARDGNFWVTDLPAGVTITRILQTSIYSVVEFSSPRSLSAAKVRIRFISDCLRIANAAQDFAGPFKAGTTVDIPCGLPGGLVLYWQEPTAVDARFTSNFNGVKGNVPVDGIVVPGDFNPSVFVAVSQDAPPVPAIQLSAEPNKRTFVEQWVNLAAGAVPHLRFELAAPAIKGTSKALCAVSVNGKTLWSNTLTPSITWQSIDLSLAAYAGRKVLITVTVTSINSDSLLVNFANLRVTNNPTPEVNLNLASPPGPGTVLFADSFDHTRMQQGWEMHISPAHGAGGYIQPGLGRLTIHGQHYKFAYLSRAFPPAATKAQVYTAVLPTGCMEQWNPGISFWWGEDRWASMSLGANGCVVELRGVSPSKLIEFTSKGMASQVYQDYYTACLQLELIPSHIRFLACTDGATWVEMASYERTSDYAGSPQLVLLGRGTGGPSPVFQNDARWETMLETTYLDSLLVGY